MDISRWATRVEALAGRDTATAIFEVDLEGTTYEGEGSAIRERHDKPDDSIGLRLALGRAIQSAGRRIEREAMGEVRQRDNDREQRQRSQTSISPGRLRRGGWRPDQRDVRQTEAGRTITHWGHVHQELDLNPHDRFRTRPDTAAPVEGDLFRVGVAAGDGLEDGADPFWDAHVGQVVEFARVEQPGCYRVRVNEHFSSLYYIHQDDLEPVGLPRPGDHVRDALGRSGEVTSVAGTRASVELFGVDPPAVWVPLSTLEVSLPR